MEQDTIADADVTEVTPPRRRRRVTRIVLLILVGLALYGGLWLRNESVRQQQLKEEREAREGGDFSNVELTGDHPLDSILPMVDDLIESVQEEITDYQAILQRTERIGDQLVGPQSMIVKVRHASDMTDEDSVPFSVYVKFTSPENLKGREVIWVEGANDGHMIVHETGLLGFKRHVVKPDSLIAMFGSRYPITDTGALVLLQKLANIGRKDRSERGADEVDVQLIDDVMSVGVKCRRFRLQHHKKAHEFDFHVAEVDLDLERKIPVRYAAYDWPDDSGKPVLTEEYLYSDVQLNVGFSDSDFDPDNPEYDFPAP